MKTKLLILTIFILSLTACSGTNAASNTSADQGAAQENIAVNQPGDPPAVEAVQPTEDPPPETAGEVSFADDVFPILQSRCLTCHGGERIEGDLVMVSYAELMLGSESGAVILPGDAEGSLLYQLASTGKMPKRGANLNTVQLETILEWINAGALDN